MAPADANNRRPQRPPRNYRLITQWRSALMIAHRSEVSAGRWEADAMADILVEVDTPANQGVKAGDPGTAQATVDDDEFNDQSPVPWGSVGARKGSVIKNGSQHTITDIHIRRTDGKKFDQKCTGGNG